MKTTTLILRPRVILRRELIAALVILLASALAEGGTIDLGSPTARTPYDQYLGPMWDVLRSLGGNQPDMGTVEQLVREGRAFHYVFKKEQPYVPQTPAETEATKSGDCKAKALWLASKMGSRNVRFVIGKASVERNVNHAWLIWEGPQGWLILDATMFGKPLQPDRLSPTDYVPNFSYAPGGKYAHAVAAAAGGKKYGDHL